MEPPLVAFDAPGGGTCIDVGGLKDFLSAATRAPYGAAPVLPAQRNPIVGCAVAGAVKLR
jgi:hypothetical protein